MSGDPVKNLSNYVMAFSTTDSMLTHPKVHMGLNAFYLQMREELAAITSGLTQRRREKLRELFVQDFLQVYSELNQVDLGFINTQP